MATTPSGIPPKPGAGGPAKPVGLKVNLSGSPAPAKPAAAPAAKAPVAAPKPGVPAAKLAAPAAAKPAAPAPKPAAPVAKVPAPAVKPAAPAAAKPAAPVARPASPAPAAAPKAPSSTSGKLTPQAGAKPAPPAGAKPVAGAPGPSAASSARIVPATGVPSSSKIAPVTPTNVKNPMAPSGRQNVPPTGASGRMKAASPAAIEEHRKKLGLSNFKPSEMVEGLDEVAEKAARVEARQSDKKKKAGKDIMMNEAIRVDDTGRRWSTAVQVGLITAVLAVVIGGGLMFWWANRTTIIPAQAALETKERLNRYQAASGRMKPYAMDAKPSPQQFKEALIAQLQKDLETYEKLRERERKNRAGTSPETRQSIEFVKQDINFKDAWGKDLVFKADGDNVLISSINREGSSEPPAVLISIPRGPAEVEKTASNNPAPQ